MKFRQFMKKSEEQDDIESTLKKLPKSHRSLVRGFDWKFQGGNTLKGDDQHIGYVDRMNGEIAVAAPWNYGREFAILHEIGHQIWDQLPEELKEQWKEICSKIKNRKDVPKELSHTPDHEDSQTSLDQSDTEIFCMCYANFYARHKLMTYYKPEWIMFIKNLPI